MVAPRKLRVNRYVMPVIRAAQRYGLVRGSTKRPCGRKTSSATSDPITAAGTKESQRKMGLGKVIREIKAIGGKRTM